MGELLRLMLDTMVSRSLDLPCRNTHMCWNARGTVIFTSVLRSRLYSSAQINKNSGVSLSYDVNDADAMLDKRLGFQVSGVPLAIIWPIILCEVDAGKEAGGMGAANVAACGRQHVELLGRSRISLLRSIPALTMLAQETHLQKACLCAILPCEASRPLCNCDLVPASCSVLVEARTASRAGQ